MLGSCCVPSSKLPPSHHDKILSSSFSSNAVGIGQCNSAISGIRFGKLDISRRKCSATKRCSTSAVLADVTKDFMAFRANIYPKHEADPKTVASIILGGGAGTRLFPLTGTRAKPAVPIGGCYRLIDVPMSNCINSGINKIYILTQFNSQSLNRHISRTYNSGNGVTFGDGFVEVLAATQTSGESGKKWFQGTADAVRQFIWLFEDAKHRYIENILILSGDHLYRMDYMDFLQKHINSGADISVSCLPVDERNCIVRVDIEYCPTNCLSVTEEYEQQIVSRASDFGLLKIDENGQIRQFLEKPKGESLRSMQVDTTLLGLTAQDAKKTPYIASMGIYLFKTDVLLKLLRWHYPEANDFGSEIIPMAMKDYNVKAYLFDGYWEDIGTIKSFFDANLALTDKVVDSIISHGCFLRECSVKHSIVGIRSRLEYGVELKDTLMMGADHYQTEAEIASCISEGNIPLGIGRNTKIMNCIIDTNTRIGKNVVIANKDNVEEADRPSEGFYIRSGITVVVKNAVIKDGTII